MAEIFDRSRRPPYLIGVLGAAHVDLCENCVDVFVTRTCTLVTRTCTLHVINYFVNVQLSGIRRFKLQLKSYY